MYICWKCQHQHQDDVTKCSQCGAINQKTILIEKRPDLKSSITAQTPSGKRALNDNMMFISELALKIGHEKLVVPIDKRVLFGRDIFSTDDFIGVDLTHFKALEMGVSRRHADLRRVAIDRLILIDLQSTNGTRVNGKHLTPFKAYTLKDNDQIFLGNLKLTIQLVGISLSAANSG